MSETTIIDNPDESPRPPGRGGGLSSVLGAATGAGAGGLVVAAFLQTLSGNLSKLDTKLDEHLKADAEHQTYLMTQVELLRYATFGVNGPGAGGSAPAARKKGERHSFHAPASPATYAGAGFHVPNFVLEYVWGWGKK
jgi:hypothetical protein